MKNIKKFLIASIILISVGIIGLISTGIVSGLSAPSDIYKTGTPCSFRSGNMMGMMRGFVLRQKTDADLKNISFDEVKITGQEYLDDIGLQNVKISEIMEFSNNFYIVTVEEDTGIGAMELLLDKKNGVIFPEYGPNMMWNQKYGMYFKFTGAKHKNNMAIDEEKAKELANSYLSKTGSDEFAGHEVHKFYGYYTIDTESKDSATVGMLSVNGFTGKVWYHNWHGTFIEKKEYSLQ